MDGPLVIPIISRNLLHADLTNIVKALQESDGGFSCILSCCNHLGLGPSAIATKGKRDEKS